VFDPDRRHLIAYVAAAVVLVVIAVHLIGRDGGSEPVASISMAAPASATPVRARPRAPAQPKQLIWVDVAGAVRRPGLYSLPAGARVAAALERAGGVRARAERAAVNLAAKLADGQQVLVPLRGHSGGAGAAAAPGASAPGSPAAGGAAAGGPSASGARTSLSSAPQAELEQLDGIGPTLAQRIIEYRDQHGGFRSVDELQEVSGIGEKRLQALKGSVAP
jgi:competence protein ComEA